MFIYVSCHVGENRMVNEWCKKISNKICISEKDKEIIQYGLNQFFWILFNFFAITMSGLLWHEVCFSLMVFFEIYFLRPYTGGYHADTEIRCCILSIGIVNTAMLLRKFSVFSSSSMFMIYMCFICIIILFSPVDNPIHPLTKVDRKYYGKKSKQLVFLYSVLLAISAALEIKVLNDSIIYTILIVGVSVLAGRWKYRKQTFIF